MKRKVFSYVTLAVTLAGIVLFALQKYEVAAYVFSVAFVSSVVSIKKSTQFFDPTVSLLGSIMLGLCFTPTTLVFPYYALAGFFLSMTGFVRTTFGNKLGLFGSIWIEPFFWITGTAFYVTANLMLPSGWQGWTLFVPQISFFAFLILGHFSDYNGMKHALEKGTQFNVEVGKPAPDFSLPDQEGNITTLSEYKNQRKNVLMIFVRGDWCPSCHIMLRTYQRNKEKFADKNITVMAIGPDPVGVNREMVESLNVEYKILSDESLECSKKYGIKKAPNNPMTKYEEGIPLPASFLVCQEGVLRYTSRADKPGEILNPAEIFSVLEKLN